MPDRGTTQFNALGRPHLETLYRVAYRLLRNRADAQDLVGIGFRTSANDGTKVPGDPAGGLVVLAVGAGSVAQRAGVMERDLILVQRNGQKMRLTGRF